MVVAVHVHSDYYVCNVDGNIWLGGGNVAYRPRVLICIQYCPCFCILKLTLHGEVPSNAAKLLDRCSRGNFECKYILFLVQNSVQINRHRLSGPTAFLIK